MGIEEVLIAPRSPWQNPYAERVIGSIRRECLNHVIVLNERHLKRILPPGSHHHNSTSS
ncbi:integrase core domain-containing protein [Thermodesulfobacteriota bacterium]